MNNQELLDRLDKQRAYDIADRHIGEREILDALEKHACRIATLEKLANLVTGAVIILGSLIGAAWAAIIAWIGAGGMHNVGQHFKK